MFARLEQSFEQLRRFTSDASHELRTPLAAIRSVGEVGLQKDGSREEYRDIIGNMLEETNRLTRLVESLLTLSRADAGQIHLQKTPVSVMALLRQSSELLEVLAEEKQQRIVLEGDEHTQVAADALLLRQAFVNILHNAIKYSPANGIIQVSVASNSHETVLVSIRDSGPGVRAEHRDKVFDRFYRAEPGRGRDSGGAGLGLAIVKWVVQSHSGKIHLDSPPDGGSTFVIQLPSVNSRPQTSG
jgi:signal transduction histidine kinase